MAMLIKYLDGRVELIPEAVSVDPHNFHEGMYDFYDARGNLLRQISLYDRITWELTDEPETNSQAKDK
ncbi:MAG TPA: hypothetical protein VF791_11650 [Pyrinomonadaceae bacterium]